MLFACGQPSVLVMFSFTAFCFFVAANFPVGLAALTAAAFRRRLDVPALRKVGAMNLVTGVLLLLPALAWPPLVVPAALLCLIGAVTRALNRPVRVVDRS